MRPKRPSTSPGILQTTYDDSAIGTSSASTLHSPTLTRPSTRGSTFPKLARPGTSHSIQTRFHVPWETKDPPASPFDENSPPSTTQLELAAKSTIVTESGVRIAFGSLWQHQKTIVIFIRHFLCPMCQDYVGSIARSVAPEALRREGIRLVIIGNGHHDFIKSYRKVLKCPYDLYTNPKLEVYNALGMTLQTLEKGPRPSYIRHGAVGGFGMVISNAFKSGMPIWKHGGDLSQLGGEFVLGPGLKCSFSHRMRYARAHLPIQKVVKEAITEPEAPILPAILVIGHGYDQHDRRFTSSRTSVLEVFHNDHRDEDDFVTPPIKPKKSKWNLPSTRRSWIIQEALENEVDLEPDRTINEENENETEHVNFETDHGPEAAVVESDLEATAEFETRVEPDRETEKSSVRATEQYIDDPDDAPIPTVAAVDWRKVQRGSLQWRRARKSTCSTTRSEASEEAPNSSEFPAPSPQSGLEFTSEKPVPIQSIPKDVSPWPSDADHESLLSGTVSVNSVSCPSHSSCDSDSLNTLSEEAQICRALVVKLLPALDLGGSLDFEEFPWFEKGSCSCPPSRRSSSRFPSKQLDPHPLRNSKNQSVASICGENLCLTRVPWM
ncbi:hypothetical protein L218DRAFT_992322 [Marasmius fiardii PR-910]|nr:hypothetical protein L218DRAFT_992322 [Marasmius fiardii PR-910]